MKARIRRTGPSRAAPRLRWIVHLPKHFPSIAAGAYRNLGPLVEVELAWADVDSEGQHVEPSALCRDPQVVAQFLAGGAGKGGQADVNQGRRDLQALLESDGLDAGALPRQSEVAFHLRACRSTKLDLTGLGPGRGAGAGQSGSVRVRQFSLPGNSAHRQLARMSTFVSCPPVCDRREVKAAPNACLPSTRRHPARASPAGCSSPGTLADGPRRSYRSGFHRRW